MSLNATFDTSEVQAKMEELSKGLADLTEPLETVGDEVIELLGEKNFEEQGAALDSKWSPLSVWTLQARARGYGHYANKPVETNKILVWTGALKAGFTKAVERTTLTIENSVEYFKHNIGKRPMMAVNDKVTAIIEKNFIAFLEALLR